MANGKCGEEEVEIATMVTLLGNEDNVRQCEGLNQHWHGYGGSYSLLFILLVMYTYISQKRGMY